MSHEDDRGSARGWDQDGMNGTATAYASWGGVHPEYNKVTASCALERLPVSSRLLVSLAQNLGAPASAVVKKGDSVARGQLIAEPSGFVSASVHAPTSGTVKSVAPLPTASGRTATVIEIEADGEDRWHESIVPPEDWQALDAKALVERVAQAGIIGMGGAGFPTHVKLSPPPGKSIDTLIVNGAECEPFLTADHRLMLEQADRIWGGVQIIKKILGVARVRVAVEDNKPDAIAAMQEVAESTGTGDVAVVALPTEYPQGAEKQLIYAVTGREVPSGGLPMDVGALVENVGTAAAIYEAVADGWPLTERVVTVSGDLVKEPKNLVARVGTPFAELLRACGGLAGPLGKVICGGPMMGIAQPSLEVAMNKTTSGLLFLSRDWVGQFSSMPCIGCARCVVACPMNLMPCSLSEFIEAEDYAGAEAEHVLDCIECGCCAFECPAHRPLVQHMKRAKAEVTARRRQREAEQKAKSEVGNRKSEIGS